MDYEIWVFMVLILRGVEVFYPKGLTERWVIVNVNLLHLDALFNICVD